jgi:hypothetical protein
MLMRKAAKSLRKRGIIGTSRHIWRITASTVVAACRLSQPPSDRRLVEDERFDAEQGVDTAAQLHPSEVSIESSDWIYGNRYQPAAVGEFELAISHCTVDLKDYVFVDVGCGKGKVLVLAGELPFQHVYGVEWGRELAETAKRNIAKVNGLDGKVTVICGDATTWALPDRPLILFLNNPFEAPLLKRFVKHIERSLMESPRDIQVLYVAPSEASAFDASSRLGRIAEVPNELLIYKSKC